MYRMLKKFFASISILSLLFTLVPASRHVQAAPARTVGFDGTVSQAFEGEMQYVKLKTSWALGNADYVDVHYTISGTASDSDYYFNNSDGVLRIKSDQTSFPLYAIDEAGLELDEKVIITLTGATDNNGQAVSIDQASKVYTHTIWDYNGQPKLSFIYDTGSSNENGNPGTFTVYLSHAISSDVTFRWILDGIGTTASDRPTTINGNTFPADILVRGAVDHSEVIPAGQTSIQIPLGIQNDNLYEGNEILRLRLRGVDTNNAILGTVLGQVYTIIDNDEPTISFQPAASSGSESVNMANFSVALSNPSIYDTTFSLAVDQAHSTARWGGVDWSLPAMVNLTIPRGTTSVNTSINITDDNEQEANETAIVSLVNVTHNGESLGGANSSFTYTITDNDAPVAPPAPPAPPVTPPAPPTVPPGVCPALSPGDMVKVSGKPAIYVVNRFNKIMYFPSGDEYKSWNENDAYGGYVTVTQDCFDNGLSTPIAPPAGVNYRPGSYVVKKENTSQLYVVLPGNTIAKITPADAKALYGANYRVMTIKFIFWSNYINTGADISGKVHSGMLVRNDNKVWYVDGNNLREVTSAGMTANRFKNSFVHTVPASYLAGFNTGLPIDGLISELTNRTQL